MALQITTNINVDFYDNKYVMVNAKQYDDMSRLFSITCYNQGDIYNLSAKNHTAYIKYRKADGRWVLNSCTINYKGQVLVELTEQMLAASGICYVDLFIVNKGSAIVNVDTGSIVTIDGSSVLTTKAFYIDVQESVFDNSLVESIDEYEGLTDLVSRAEAEYGKVIQAAKSYAIGTGNTARENDENDNSKYYSKLSESYTHGGTGIVARNTNGVVEATDNAKYYNEMAESYARGYTKNNIRDGEDTDNAKHYYELARSYTVGDNEKRNGEEIDNAYYYYQMSESYAKGDTEGDIRNGEDTDNAEYYSRLSKSYAKGDLDGDTETRDGESVDNAEYYSRLSKSYAKGGTNIAERNTDSIVEDTDNAEYYSRLSKSYSIGSFDGSTGTRDDEGTENAKTYMETALNHATTSQRYAVGGTNTIDGEDTDNSEYYYKLSRSYTKGDINLRTDENIDNAEYYYKLARSYTKGNIGLRDGEDVDNAEYYLEQCTNYADNASASKTDAEKAQVAAEAAQALAETAQQNAETAQRNAEIAQQNAEQAASKAAQNAVDNVSALMNDYVTASKESATNAEQAASNAAQNAVYDVTTLIDGYVATSKSYAVGGTGSRENEDVDNAKYYYELANSIANNISNIATVDEVKEYLGIERGE